MKPQNGTALQPLLDTQQNQLAFVSDEGSSIDSKALAILATNIALLIFIEQSVHDASFWLLSLLLAPFLISTIFTLFAIWPRQYRGASASLDDYPEYLSLNHSDLILQLIADTREAIRVNNYINKKRWRFFMYSLLFAAIGFAAILVYFN